MIARISVASENCQTAKRTGLLIFAYFLLSLSGGLLTGSLALWADTAHTLCCVGGLGMVLFADWTRRVNPQPIRPFYHGLAAVVVVHSAALFLSGILILYVAYGRLRHVQDVAALPVLLIAMVGCVIKVICIIEVSRKPGLARLGKAPLGMEVNLIMSVVVAAAAAATYKLGRTCLDSAVGAVGVLFFVPRIWQLMNQTADVLLEPISRASELHWVDGATGDERRRYLTWVRQLLPHLPPNGPPREGL